MPIYEYECKACGYRHEVLQKVNDPALTDCPSCEKSTLKKLISATGFRLSGSGWYETDFKSDNKRNLATQDTKKADEKDSKKSDKKDAKSSESSDKKTTKSAAKPSSKDK